ncbi:autophagy-related protein 2 homolog A isoform X2 [Bombina bombina]|uniref:autophagy-related protein 2 homolog A isoform X2 n=1 Tax=Bombina bombina TaxID=8345 RepID=UPI00235A7403|nr:autophagy-related protein 2 homolog A isoform X2 [Bombina bombina]
MSRWLFPWSSSIKTRACRYLLQHYLGHYLEERLSLEQLSLDLYNGSGRLTDIHLDIWSVNELLESTGAPLEITDGFIGSISVTIPWSALVTENCTLEVSRLQVTCRPKYRSAADGPESHSWSSCMTTSMQLAQECLKEQAEEPTEPPQPIEGLEMFAQTIETVLRRIKVTFLDTIIRIENTPEESSTRTALEIHIKRLDYCDEAVRDCAHTIPVDIHQPPAFIQKILQLSGVSLRYEEFNTRMQSPSPSPAPEDALLSSRHTDPESISSPGAPSRPAEPTTVPVPTLEIGSCSGCTEMTIKLKQNDMFPGPKLEIDGKIGSLHMFLTPQQIGNLQQLMDALSISESSSIREKLLKSRPLDQEDLKLIEQDLNQQLHSGPGSIFVNDPELVPFQVLENGDMFFSMAAMTNSATSIRSANELSDVDLESSIYSNYSSHQIQTPAFTPGLMLNSPRRYGQSPFSATLPPLQNLHKMPGKSSVPPSLEPLKPEMLVKLSLGGLTVTIPHLPPDLCAPQDTYCAETTSNFFKELGYFKDAAFSGRDFGHLRGHFQKACQMSNIRITAAAVQIICEQRIGRGAQQTSADLSFGILEILECLWQKKHLSGTTREPEYTELMVFRSPASSSRPCTQIHYKRSHRKPSRSSRKKQPAKVNSEILVELEEFQSDLDLGLIDRLGSLFEDAVGNETVSAGHLDLHTNNVTPAPEEDTDIRVVALKAHLRLQFPVPDLRPRPERRPWSEKVARKEYLDMEVADMEIHTQRRSGTEEPSKIEITFSDLHGVYTDGLKLRVPCIRISKGADPLGKTGKKISFPSILVTLLPQNKVSPWDLVQDRMEDPDLPSVESPCELKQPEPSPFSSKRTMYETEEMVIPADSDEMSDFQQMTLASSQYTLKVTLPRAHIFLPSKDVYESLYNRLCNDLLMWESASATGSPVTNSPIPPEMLTNSTYHQDTFRMCKSAFRLDSDSEDEDSHFYSVDELARARKSSQEGHSFFSASITILKGRVTAWTETKCEGGKRLDGHHGEVVLDVENGQIFSVSKYRGKGDLSYLCIESDSVSLSHKATIEDYLPPTNLEIPTFLPPAHLEPTIYPSEEGVSAQLSGARKDRNSRMLSLAIRIDLNLVKNVKEFLVALRLDGATLRHHMALPNQSWHSQILEFLDVIDEPILGYSSPAVITVLHTHLFSCAVDYRPLYLPVRVLITAETFTLSSNIVVDTSTFMLRFILDDSALYLSDKCEADVTDLKKDYVCVLDVDLLELVITTWKGSSSLKMSQPLFELRCSNNVLHIHTCADSCAMLANLTQYVMNNGDLHCPPKPEPPTEIAGQKLQPPDGPASQPSCLPAETSQINQGDLTDALIDTGRSGREHSEAEGDVFIRQNSPVSVYLFPEEVAPGNRLENLSPSPPLRPASQESLGLSDTSGDSELTDTDDFCILDAPGIGVPPKNGEPVVRKLVAGPIAVKDGHFSRPLGSTDLLKPPAKFPVPETRIVLREISVVWHLYGGKDFGSSRPNSARAHSPRTRTSLQSARGSPSRSSVTNRPQNTWRTQGGNGRIHDILIEIQLTKVSFQHETYPAPLGNEIDQLQTGEAEEVPLARQVFIVQELEIRDRLASSQINKFLYLYTSEKMPRRAHSNMLTIKALHVRPEAGLGGPECCLRMSLMPLRLNIDQDALFFLKDFFVSLASGIQPVVPVELGSEASRLDGQRRQSSSETESALETSTQSSEEDSASPSSASDQPIYFREFRFTSEVPIWLDYQGKHVSTEQVGTFAGILIGLAQLNCSELKLKRLYCRHGLLGADKVVSYALNEWLTDIRKNQLPGILGGVGPMHSVVQLFHGVRDLFWLPIEQYRKDGRIIRGLQRGAASFGTSTASAALELSNRLVQAIQATAETVYDILSPTPPVSRCAFDVRMSRRIRRGQQPADLREGVAKAYDTVREGVIDTAQTIREVASRGHEQKGLTGAVGGVLRQIPPTVVKPFIVATEATSNLLGGMRNQIRPDAHKEDSQKWRADEGQD